MPDDVFTAACRFLGAPPETNANQLGYGGSAFIAGAAWGLLAAKLSQSEIAAIVAAVAAEKKES